MRVKQRLDLAFLDSLVRLQSIGTAHDLPRLQLSVATERDADFVHDNAVFDLAIRAFNKAVLIDPCEARERTNETDVRTLRRFDRANPTVVRGVNIAHLKARALPRKTTRSKRRQATLVGDFRQRIRLIHELRKL